MYIYDEKEMNLNSYILYYDDELLKEDGLIRVYYGDKSKIDIPYNEGNIEKLNNKMELQIRCLSSTYIDSLESVENLNTIVGYPTAAILGISLMLLRNGSSSAMIFVLLSSWLLGRIAAFKILSDKLINDLYKNQMFLEDKRLFEKFDKSNPKHLKNISGYAKKKLLTSTKNPILDINVIDSMSYKDLCKIRENLNSYFDKTNGFSHTYRI